MELINRYIFAIKKRLPAKMSEDIANEIKSLLFDELEEKFGEKETYTKEEIETVLKEMGPPRKVAQRYRGGKQYLIGPEIFPIFKMVTSIVLGATTLGLVISYIVSAFTMESANAWQVVEPFFGFFFSLLSAWMSAFGGLVFTFAVIDHFTNLEGKEIDLSEDWKPSDLPELPEEKDIVPLYEPIIALFFIIVCIILLNSYVYTKGAFVETISSVTILPILNIDALRNYLPIWNLSLGLSLALEIVHLVQRRRSLFTRIFEIALSLLSITVLVMLLHGPILVHFDQIAAFFSETNLTVASLTRNYRLILKVMIGLTSFGMLINIIKLIVSEARKANV